MDYDLGPVREPDPALEDLTLRDTAGIMMDKLRNNTIRHNERRENDRFKYAHVRPM